MISTMPFCRFPYVPLPMPFSYILMTAESCPFPSPWQVRLPICPDTVCPASTDLRFPLPVRRILPRGSVSGSHSCTERSGRNPHIRSASLPAYPILPGNIPSAIGSLRPVPPWNGLFSLLY